MLPLGISIGLIVRIGQLLVHDAKKAATLAKFVVLFTAVCGLVVSSSLYVLQNSIVTAFSHDQEVIEGSSHIWKQLCIYVFCLYCFGINQGIMRALGMQWRLAFMISSYLFLVVLPAVVYFAVIKKGGLYTQWTILAICYILFQIILVFGYIQEDWEAHSTMIKMSMRESIRRLSKTLDATETDALLGPV